MQPTISFTVLTILASLGSILAAVTSDPSAADGKTFDYIVVRCALRISLACTGSIGQDRLGLGWRGPQLLPGSRRIKTSPSFSLRLGTMIGTIRAYMISTRMEMHSGRRLIGHGQQMKAKQFEGE